MKLVLELKTPPYDRRKTMATEPPLVVIVGPTASGKSDLAMNLAEKFGGEIICADSRTVYRGMDIGTAKPNLEDQRHVPHHLLDIVNPDQRFTVADFQKLARQAITDIRRRGKIPFLVGGTGLYIDSVILDYNFDVNYDKNLRERLEKMTIDQLQKYCNINNISLPQNHLNKRYLIRTIERGGTEQRSSSNPISNSIIVGITTDKNTLKTRIVQRAEHIFESGVVQEANKLGKKYGWKTEAMTGNIYPLAHQILTGELSLEQVKQRFIILDWQLAKRQLTWLKRHPFIQWETLKTAAVAITNQLDFAKIEQK